MIAHPSVLEAGQRLPPLRLPAADSPANAPAAGDVALRTSDRRATVLVTVHRSCAGCTAWLRELLSARAAINEWDGRVVLVSAERADVESRRDAPVDDVVRYTGDGVVRYAADPEGRLRRAGVPVPGVLIADQWGELALVTDPGDDHELPSAGEVVDWLRYLATKCPECEGEAL